MATVDSSVGGKTGVNHPLGKNMIGAFYQPQCVLIDTDTLNTLPDRELASGISEIIKYGLIRDAPLFQWLEQNMDKLMQRDPQVSVHCMVYLHLACSLHREVQVHCGRLFIQHPNGMILSCPALSCPALPCPALPCPVLPCPVLSCPVLSCPVLSCPVLSCPVLSCPVLSCPVLSCPVLSCPVLSCPALPCPALCCPAHLLYNRLYAVARVHSYSPKFSPTSLYHCLSVQQLLHEISDAIA